ncbi:MAG: hypothetical protein FWD53_11300 [Phycisphaerales bacterium]|nr:hypothetical protein [Phycisphaerales bacterium]
MSEPPPKPPILDYATPERRVPVYLVVILCLWAVFDVLSGVGLFFVGFPMATNPNPHPHLLIFQTIGYILIFVGPILFLWGTMTFWLANRMQRNHVAVLRWAAYLVIVPEFFTWASAGMLYWLFAGEIKAAWPLPTFFVVVAVAVSVTRILLWRAVKRMAMGAN